MPDHLPECLRDLPVCPKRLLPIPFAAVVNPDGTGEFTVNDTRRKLACGYHRLCGIGGLALAGPVVLLGIDQGARLDRLVFTDPPMHEACAEASLTLCPYIYRERVPRRPPPPGVVPNAPDITEDPAKPGWVWVLAAGFEMITQPRRGGGLVAAFRPGPLLAVRRFGYHGDQLRERAA